MKNQVGKLIYWTPRILSILFIAFLALFSLDIFDGHYGFWGTIAGLLMHNIPVFILAIVLWLSWKREIVGGIVFILAGTAHMVSSIMRETIDPWYMALAISLILDGPAFFIGALFLVGWFKKNKREIK